MTFAIMTTVAVEEGSIDELARVFDETNRELVSDHDGWLGAWFTANRETSVVTVIARWTDADAYQRLRSSDEFQAAMARFAERFTGAPTVTVNEILVEM